MVRSHSHFLKLDVAQCFASIGHGLVLETLEQHGLAPEALRLCERVLAGPDERLGRGLPIGNLTSQWFANLVLGRIDRFALRELCVPGYVRYMDDFVLFAGDKSFLRSALGRMEEFVDRDLALRLKERATILAPVSQGLPFLGRRIYRGTTRLRPENARRTRQRLRQRRWELRTGRIEAPRYIEAVRSVLAHLERAFGEPQQRHAGEPGQRPRPPSRQGVATPDRAGPAGALCP
jgi:hypothetical protein